MAITLFCRNIQMCYNVSELYRLLYCYLQELYSVAIIFHSGRSRIGHILLGEFVWLIDWLTLYKFHEKGCNNSCFIHLFTFKILLFTHIITGSSECQKREYQNMHKLFLVHAYQHANTKHIFWASVDMHFLMLGIAVKIQCPETDNNCL